MNSISMLHAKTKSLLVMLLVGVMPAIGANESAAAKQIIYLHTEFMPYQHVDEDDMCYRLMREMVRQSVLISARDELGVESRDGTLRESPPENTDGVEIVHLAALQRTNQKVWHVKLFALPNQADGAKQSLSTKGLWTSEPVWEHKFEKSKYFKDLYLQGAETFAGAAESEFVSALQKAGIVGQPHGQERQHEPSPSKLARWEESLLKVDFVAQYAVLREVHKEIAEHGQSKGLLSLLVRGYANLSVLTEHQWNHCSEVFAARSLLYAERLAGAHGRSDDVLLVQAYSQALIGLHNGAFRNLNKLKIDRSDMPDWGKLIEPYIRFDHDRLQELADDGVATPWALRLHFALLSTYRISIWEYKAGLEIAERVPTAYGVFNNLSGRPGQLAALRLGASMAPRLFETHLPTSMREELDDLPRAVIDVLDDKQVPSVISGSFPRDQLFTQLPSRVAQSLRGSSRDAVGGPLSWSVLAYLIEEERFAQSANYLAVATNAVESSLRATADHLLKVNSGHRYSPYLDRFGYDPVVESDSIAAATALIPIEDPKPSMRWMLYPVLEQLDDKEIPKSELYWYKERKDFTMQGIVNYAFRSSSHWTPKKSNSQTGLSTSLQWLSPHCEASVRLALLSCQDPGEKRLQKWEAEIKHDPYCWATLAYHYKESGDWESAIRCYQESQKIHPNDTAVEALAEYYWQKDDFDNWERTYLDYLDTESIGLEHNAARFKLAEGYILRGYWEQAKPYAEASGKTYSSGGLRLAAAVTEGVGDWKASEHWHQALSTNYPTYFGKDWYLFCRRTGRGDVTSALMLAQHYYSDNVRIKEIEHPLYRGSYNILLENFESALESFREMDRDQPNTMTALMIAQLAEELGDNETRQRALEKRAQELAAAEDSPAHRLASRTFEFMRTKQITPEELAEIDKLIADDDVEHATKLPMMYFIGRHYARTGQHDLARHYLLPVLNTIEDTQSVRSPFRTLAGVELVEIDGVSRPDDDSLDTKEKARRDADDQ